MLLGTTYNGQVCLTCGDRKITRGELGHSKWAEMDVFLAGTIIYQCSITTRVNYV